MPRPTSLTFTGLLLALSILFVPGICPASDFGLEASLSGNSNNNLFADSSGRYSNSTVSSLDVDYYATSFAKLNLVGEYTYYRQVSRLSNLLFGGGMTLIPTSDSSRLSVIFSGNVRKREYRDDGDTAAINANEFTGNEYDARVGVGYDLTPGIQLRSTLSFGSVGYGLDGVMDRETYEVSVGGNTSLFERVGLDVELGYARGRYQYVDPIKSWPDPIGDRPREIIAADEAYDILLEDDLRSLYFSPRVSTSFGGRTGVSLTWSIRQFQDHNADETIYGYSSGYLSPWKESYEGQAVVLNIKTYLVPRLNISLMVGYWDKDYLRLVEYETWLNNFGQPRSGVNLAYARERSDYRHRLSLKVKMPLAHRAGYLIEPSLTIDYTDNRSIVPVYDYTSFLVSGGLTVRF